MNAQDLEKSRAFWDRQAATFDDEPDHGLRDPVVYSAWEDLFASILSPAPTKILDIGCGTGTLSVLLSRLGHQVAGVDLAPEMIARAKAKADRAEQPIDFSVMNAAHPRFDEAFDVIVCRHLLWALPEPTHVLQRWAGLLAPGGRLILVEGYWNGAGLHARELIGALPASVDYKFQDLSDEPTLWGGPVDDERYVVVARMS